MSFYFLIPLDHIAFLPVQSYEYFLSKASIPSFFTKKIIIFVKLVIWTNQIDKQVRFLMNLDQNSK